MTTLRFIAGERTETKQASQTHEGVHQADHHGLRLNLFAGGLFRVFPLQRHPTFFAFRHTSLSVVSSILPLLSCLSGVSNNAFCHFVPDGGFRDEAGAGLCGSGGCGGGPPALFNPLVQKLEMLATATRQKVASGSYNALDNETVCSDSQHPFRDPQLCPKWDACRRRCGRGDSVDGPTVCEVHKGYPKHRAAAGGATQRFVCADSAW